MTTAVFILLALLALTLVAVLWALDVEEDRRSEGAYRASARQRRQWRRERQKAGWTR